MECLCAVAIVVGALGKDSSDAGAAKEPLPAPAGDVYAKARDEMVATQIAARGVRDASVLAALRRVPRHSFVPAPVVSMAYDDRPLPIGWRQTISQPYIVGLMSELARVRPGARVLEIGTGSGYQAAVLHELGAEVYTIEIITPLAQRTAATLDRLGYAGVHVRIGDGYRGWAEAAPFDAILVTAAPPIVPEPLRQQLKIGGRLVVPVGTTSQELRVIERTKRGFEERVAIPVLFVPMTGEVQTAGTKPDK